MSVDAAEAEFLDEPMPESPLKDRLSQALPKAPAGLQWKVDTGIPDEVNIALQTREGGHWGSRTLKLPAYGVVAEQIIGLVANTAKELVAEHTRRCIMLELSGAYEGQVA